MHEQDIEPDVITFTQAQYACTNGGEWELSLLLFDHTVERGVKLNRAIYKATIDACEKGGQWERALDLMDQMDWQGVQPDVTCFNRAIASCAKSGQWECALRSEVNDFE